MNQDVPVVEYDPATDKYGNLANVEGYNWDTRVGRWIPVPKPGPQYVWEEGMSEWVLPQGQDVGETRESWYAHDNQPGWTYHNDRGYWSFVPKERAPPGSIWDYQKQKWVEGTTDPVNLMAANVGFRDVDGDGVDDIYRSQRKRRRRHRRYLSYLKHAKKSHR